MSRSHGILGLFLAVACAFGCGEDAKPTSPVGIADAGSEAVVESGAETREACSTRSSAAVEVDNALGTLHGTLELPDGCGPFTALLIIAGSGPTDRNCNGSSLHTDAYKLLAEALADRGIASVRYDKRGIAESARAGPGNESDYRIEHFVEDAARWTDRLRSDERFDRVRVAGHSEGALIGLLLSRDRNLDALISLAGTGRRLGVVLREQLARQLPPDLLARAEAIISELEQGRTVSDVPPELASVFRPSVQPYLISVFRHDPAELMASVSVPGPQIGLLRTVLPKGQVVLLAKRPAGLVNGFVSRSTQPNVIHKLRSGARLSVSFSPSAATPAGQASRRAFREYRQRPSSEYVRSAERRKPCA